MYKRGLASRPVIQGLVNHKGRTIYGAYGFSRTLGSRVQIPLAAYTECLHRKALIFIVLGVLNKTH
jgi:hypothetical protein